MAVVRDIALNDAGDWFLDGADLSTVADADAIRQSVRIRMEFFKGEWFLDLTAGVPYFQEVLVKAPDVNVLRNVFATAITETPGISSLTSLTLVFDRKTRKLTVTYEAQTDVGALQSTEVL